jgi:uncharacterized protein (TIGR01777 family)
MHIIITGGTGLIGRNLSASLIQDGHKVTVLSRNPDNYTGELPKGVTAVQWDAKTAAGWGHLADGADAIVNLAGAGIADKRWSDARKKVIVQSRVDAGNAVTEAVRAAKVKPAVVIQASGVGYYGPSNDSKLTEASPAGNDYVADVVKQWELSTAGVEAAGVRRVVFRIGIVLSTEGGALPKLTLPFQFMAGGPLGTGDQWYSWVHIDDVVNALKFAIRNAAMQGVYNLTSPGPVPNIDIARKIGLVLNRPSLVAAPSFALKLALGEMATVVLDGQRVVPERLLKAGFRFQFADAEVALRDLLVTQPAG